MKLGSADIAAIKLGAVGVTKVMLGAVEVWNGDSEPPPEAFWDFSPYPPGEQPDDWTARWNTANVAWSIRLHPTGSGGTDFDTYALGAPAGWTARWNTANVTWEVEEGA